MIRAATSEDWNAIEQLLVSSNLPLDGARDHLRDFVVAEENGAIAGCAALERYGSSALLRSVVVDSSVRGSGLGEKLVRQIIDHARREGIESMVLLTTTAPEWFPRFGFRRAERERVPPAVKASVEFQGACPDTSIVMQLDL